MGFLDELLNPPAPPNLSERNCKNCAYSEFQGVICKLVDPPRKLTTPKEAQLCIKYTPMASDDATKQAVQEVEGKTDVVAAAVGTVKLAVDSTKDAVDALKGAGTKTLTDVSAAVELAKMATEAVKTEVEGVQVAVASVDSKTEAVKAAVDQVRYMVARPAWYDRNPVSRTLRLVQNASSSAFAQYTVPVGKKAMLEAVFMSVQRTIPAGSYVSHADAVLNFVPQAGDSVSLCTAVLVDNTEGATAYLNLGQTIFLFAGDSLRAFTVDASTSGSCLCLICAKLTEFDV
jgi:hypothetical protein